MKRLTLIRHAKSSWKEADVDDFDRPLNKRGQRDAPMMGKRFAKQELYPQLFVSSPAKRALDTANIIAYEISFPVEDIVEQEQVYQASVEQLLELVQGLDDEADDAWLVGHNPGLTELANALSDYQTDNLPTCAVFRVEFPVKHWQDVKLGEGQFLSFDFPKNLD